jgi:regulator of cell morphogenesis and NO signaling
MNILKSDETIGNLVAADARKAGIFNKMGIDYCCAGTKTLKEVSDDLGITEEQLALALDDITMLDTKNSIDFSSWGLNTIIDYIVNVHHSYARKNSVVIYDLVQEVYYRHAENHPELKNLASTSFLFLHYLLNQMTEEEDVIFPYIRSLGTSKIPPGYLATRLDLLRSSVEAMRKAHHEAGENLKLIRKLTNNYSLPGDACNSYRALLERLRSFEYDLKFHVHMENNILFPRALLYEDGSGK